MRASRSPESPWGPVASSAGSGPIEASYWVIPDRLLAGGHPHHAGLDAGSRLTEAGFDVWVDLTEPTETHEHPDVVIRDGLTLIGHPIVDLDIPSPERMVEILDSIDRSLGAGSSVYVHCHAGLGRTGTVIGCWLIRHQLTPPDSAVDLIARLRSEAQLGCARSPETDEQTAFVNEWLPHR